MKTPVRKFLVTLFAAGLVLLISGCASRPLTCQDRLSDRRSAANGGDVEAQILLAASYHQGVNCVPRDYKESMKWYRKADQQGHAKAPNGIGLLYTNGNGVPQDMKEGEKWFRKGFERGDIEATDNLGVLLTKNKNYPEAVQMFQIAAAGGNIKGRYNLGVSYYFGLGVKQNFTAAEREFLSVTSSSQRHPNKPEANYLLGDLYENGRVGPRDLKKAMSRYQQAANAGHTKAKKAVERLKVATEWSSDKFITLFPSPQTGWTAGKLEVKELKVPTTDFESFVSGMSGTKVAPHIRLQMARRYYRTQENWMEMAIDTFDPKTASTIQLMFENQEIRDKMAKEGARTLKVGKSRGILGDTGNEKGLILKVGNVGIVALACRYQDCDKDIELFSKRLDLEKITRFAKYPHHKIE